MKRKQKRRKQKKQNQRTVKFLLLSLSVFFFFFIVDELTQTYDQEKSPSVHNDPLVNIKKYAPLFQSEVQKVHLEEHTVVLAAVMLQESKGIGGDPMQASESAGLAPNSIKDPKQSIKLGVKHFERTVTYGKQKKVDFPTIIQAYNMGIGYIDFVAEHGGKHSEEIAKSFSLIKWKKNQKSTIAVEIITTFAIPIVMGILHIARKLQKILSLSLMAFQITLANY